MSEPTAALRALQIVFAVCYCLLTAGLIFGFAALKPILIAEGVYAESCQEGERKQTADGTWLVCEEQDIRLNLCFTIAAVATSVGGFPSGWMLDRLGPLKTSIIGAVLLITGSLLFGLGYQSAVWPIDTYIVGYLFLALGGPLICLSSFHLSNAFPQYAGLVLSSITGSFDASSLPLVAYQFVYRSTGGRPSPRTFFWIYTIIPCTLIIEQLFIAPKTTYQRLAPSSQPRAASEEDSLIPREQTSENLAAALIASGFSHIHLSDDIGDNAGMVKAHAEKDSLTGALYGLTAWEQIKSKWFILLTAFVCVHMARINFFILSIDLQLETFVGSHAKAKELTTLFTVMLPLGGIAGIPFVGLLIDRLPFLYVMVVALFLGSGFGLLGMATTPSLQILGFGCFVVFRPLLYTAVSEAIAKICGFESFGTIYGLAMTIAGFVALVNAPLDVLVKTRLHSYIPVDAVYLLLGVITTSALVFVIWQHTSRANRASI